MSAIDTALANAILDCATIEDFANDPAGLLTSRLGQTYPNLARIAQALAAAGDPQPGGRLTLASGQPVMASDVVGATAVYYTPYKTAFLPLWSGTVAMPQVFTELSQATTDATKSPAACAPNSCYDLFVWDDAGTLRLSRGPAWSQAQTFTITIATPGTVTCAGHGLYEGQPVVLTTTGALPTGLAAGTTYYVCRVVDANTFTLSTSLANAIAGTAIATTGTQSGVHTATQSLTVRGTAAAISRNAAGFYTNAVAITNGPAIGRGTYVGTIRTNAASTVDWICNPADTVGGGSCALHVWNAYNRVLFESHNVDATSPSYTYTTLTWRPRKASAAGVTTFVCGLPEDHVELTFMANASNSTASIGRAVSAQFDTLTKVTGGGQMSWGSNAAAIAQSMAAQASRQFTGGHMAVPLEISTATGTCTWTGTNGNAGERWNDAVLKLLA